MQFKRTSGKEVGQVQCRSLATRKVWDCRSKALNNRDMIISDLGNFGQEVAS
jgi:hypothetical protein